MADSPEATVCTFGKHPGWNDHMERFGLNNAVLVSFHRSLYQEGISFNIGSWDTFEAESGVQTLRFNHDFVWHHNDDIIMGRMWYSKDGKGRDRYPMFSCVHSRGSPSLYC